MRRAALLVLLAGPAMAEDLPVLGSWGNGTCSETRLTVGSAMVEREGRPCPVRAIVALGATGGYALRLECPGEALSDIVLLYDREGDRVWLWSEPGQARPVPLARC